MSTQYYQPYQYYNYYNQQLMMQQPYQQQMLQQQMMQQQMMQQQIMPQNFIPMQTMSFTNSSPVQQGDLNNSPDENLKKYMCRNGMNCRDYYCNYFHHPRYSVQIQTQPQIQTQQHQTQ